MYQYYRKCHSTHILLEEENKQIIDDWENINYRHLWLVQERLRVKLLNQTMEKDKPTFGIAVDGWCSGTTKLCGYRGIDIETGEELFLQNHLGIGTNNIAEFLGIVHALGFIKFKNGKAPVYSDSEIAIAFVNKKNCNTGMKEYENPELYKKIRRAELFLLDQKSNVIIKKWETKKWGEIPADFGNKISQ